MRYEDNDKKDKDKDKDKPATGRQEVVLHHTSANSNSGTSIILGKQSFGISFNALWSPWKN